MGVHGSQVSARRLARTVQRLAGQRYSEAERESARRAVAEMLADAGWQLATAPGGTMDERTGINLIARHPDGREDGPRIVIGAHIDTCADTPGADDNASGVAGLVELAHVLNDQPIAARVELVAFDLEESSGPAAGSGAYVASLTGRDASLEVALILEMIGYRCATPGCQTTVSAVADCLEVGVPDMDVGTYVAAVGNPAARGWVRALADVEPTAYTCDGFFVNPIVVADDGRCFPDARRSDNAAFWDAGLPAVMIVDTANLRNPHYHGTGDQPGTLDYGFLADVVRAVAGAVSELEA